LKLKTMPTTLEKLDMPVNVFKGTNLSTGSLMVCSDGKYVTIKASFKLNVRIIQDDGKLNKSARSNVPWETTPITEEYFAY